jgi:hypothetical protein
MMCLAMVARCSPLVKGCCGVRRAAPALQWRSFMNVRCAVLITSRSALSSRFVTGLAVPGGPGQLGPRLSN